MSANMNSGRYRPLLRPMDLGEVLDQSFKLYRHAWKPLVTVGLLSAIPTILVNGGLRSFTAMDPKAPNRSWFFQAATRAEMGDYSGLAMLVVLFLGAMFVAFLLSPLIQGALISVCSSTYMGQPISAGGAFRTAGRKYLPLLGTSLLVALMVLVSLPVAVIAGLVIFSPITIIGAFAAISTYTAFTRHAVLLEGAGGGIGAIKRSFRLASGRFWPLLGMGVIFSLLAGVANSMVSFIVGLPVGIVTVLTGPSAVLNWLVAIVTGLTAAVTTPFVVCGLTLAYYDTRIRKEGFDLELLAQSQTAPPTQPL